MQYPSYLEAYENGSLNQVLSKASEMLKSCNICPRKCRVNRLKNELGFCKTGLKPKVCSYLAHHGEEPPISGRDGSGTIFFSHCNMSCVYCQNFEFSQLGEGRQVEVEELAKMMIHLQELGAHNLNLVTPTHVLPQILKALMLAIPLGLKIPLVYNTGGYELAEVIKLLAGIVDIYLPDMRYGDTANALKYSFASDYPKYNQEAVKEMHRQVGLVELDEFGIIKKGLIIRHLVLPNNLSGTKQVMGFIAKEISPETYISLMSQYSPYYKANQYKELSRRITANEYQATQNIIQEDRLYNGWVQDSYGLERFAGVNLKPNI